MKFARGFLLSLGFMGLALLAFNPYMVVEIQNWLAPRDETPASVITPAPELTDVGAPSSETPVHIEQNAEDLKPNPKTPVPKTNEVKLPILDILKPTPSDAEISIVESEIIQPKISERVKPKSRSLPVTAKPDENNLPVIDNFDQIAKNDDWIGQTPCNIDVFEIPKHLPTLSGREDGPFFTESLKATGIQDITNQPTYIFKSESGVTLKVIRPIIDYYDLSGPTYNDVISDLFERRPLEALRQSNPDYPSGMPMDSNPSGSGNERTPVTMADIASPTTVKTSIGGMKDRFEIYPRQTEVTIGFLVTLPQWKNYAFATTEDQEKWDDKFCYAMHHELGHLRIRLDLLAETLDGFATLPPARSFDEMRSLMDNYQKRVMAIIDKRQDAYHIYNGGGTRHGMIELPYFDLPFPWLKRENSDLKTAEQSPE